MLNGHRTGAQRALLLSVLIGGVLCIGAAGRSIDERAQGLFRQAVTAVEAAQGERVLALLTPDSRRHIETIRRHAMRSESSVLRSLPLADRLAVLSVRHVVGSAKLLSLPTAPLLSQELAAHRKEIDPSRVSISRPLSLGQVYRSAILLDGVPIGAWLKVVEVGGVLRFDWRGALDAYVALIPVTAALRGVSEDQLLVEWLGRATGRRVPASIWQPIPLKRTR